MKLGEAMYKAQQARRRRPKARPEAKADEGVVDAEFEEVADDKQSA